MLAVLPGLCARSCQQLQQHLQAGWGRGEHAGCAAAIPAEVQELQTGIFRDCGPNTCQGLHTRGVQDRYFSDWLSACISTAVKRVQDVA